MQIERLRRAHLPEVLAIERQSFAAPWNRASFEAEMSKSYSHLYVARSESGNHAGAVLGYICFWLVADEIQINNLAVLPGCRRCGIGRRLLLQALRFGYEAGARLAVLEVRRSNLAALGLYRQLGFILAGQRPNYYGEVGEDGLVLSLNLDAKWWEQWQAKGWIQKH